MLSKFKLLSLTEYRNSVVIGKAYVVEFSVENEIFKYIFDLETKELSDMGMYMMMGPDFPAAVAFTIIQLDKKGWYKLEEIKPPLLDENDNNYNCPHCSDWIGGIEEEVKEYDIIPIPRKLHGISSYNYLWSCQSCYNLIEPPLDKQVSTNKFHAEYEPYF